MLSIEKLKQVMQHPNSKEKSPSTLDASVALVATVLSALAEKSLASRNSVIFICSWAAISNSIIGLFS